MTLYEELAAATVVTGFHATDVASFHSEVGSTQFGGYVFFARNLTSVEQGRALTDAMRARTNRLLPPVIAIDQEGGRVVRLRDGVESLPSAMAMSATGDSTLIAQAGEQCAFDLRRLGMNVNFAPVLDLALEPQSTVIGTRSFGRDPSRVIAMAGAFARGLQRGGIVATSKHFPGHGGTSVDSHLALPVIDGSLQRLAARDLAPFRALLPQCRAVMSAHIVIEALHDDRPVTLNGPFLNEWLRTKCGFSGVLFSDALEMQAIAGTLGIVEGAICALLAGVDALILAGSPDESRRIIRAIASAISSGRIPLERMIEAVARMRTLRTQLSPPLAVDALPPYPGIAKEISARGITTVRGNASAPVHRIVAFSGDVQNGAVDLEPSANGIESRIVTLPLQPNPEQVDALLRSLGDERVVVFMRRAHLYPEQHAAIVRILAERPETLLISTLEPYDALNFPQAHHVVCTYGDDAAMLSALRDVLDGRGPTSGSLPVL